MAFLVATTSLPAMLSAVNNRLHTVTVEIFYQDSDSENSLATVSFPGQMGHTIRKFNPTWTGVHDCLGRRWTG